MQPTAGTDGPCLWRRFRRSVVTPQPTPRSDHSNNNGSQQQLQKIDQFTPPPPPPPPLLPVTFDRSIIISKQQQHKHKDDTLFMFWIFKFAPRKKLGMLLLCSVSVAVMFLMILYIRKGEVTQEFGPIRSLGLVNISGVGLSGYSPPSFDERRSQEYHNSLVNDDNMEINVDNDKIIMAQPPLPPPPIYFTGYALPPGNPCETFTLPPPPADKKRTGPRPCPVCYLPVEEAIALMPKAPSFSAVVQNLTYIHEENLTRSEFGGSVFGGYPSLKQRLESYEVKESMTVHCGFVTGDKPGRKTGFDIDDSDLFEMDQCRGVLVASAIFGAYDLIQQPKNMSEVSKQTVCFIMFVDEQTERFLRNSSNLNDSKRIGLWRIIVIHKLPYTDPRRNGKVPKLLLHRLFPNVKYSLWVDGKLELVVDPYQILERFLWRKNTSFAVSRHYKRFDVFVEGEANKAAAKYDNASIDFQIDFYKREGLTPYSEAKLPITSDVPEGCVVIREHIPISNLFTCLWFNEVDRFTSRDQLSFSTVRDKIMSKTNWTVNMFWDCERRNFVVQGYHRDILEHWAPPPPPPVALVVSSSPPEIPIDETPKRIVSNPTNIPTIRRRRDQKSS